MLHRTHFLYGTSIFSKRKPSFEFYINLRPFFTSISRSCLFLWFHASSSRAYDDWSLYLKKWGTFLFKFFPFIIPFLKQGSQYSRTSAILESSGLILFLKVFKVRSHLFPLSRKWFETLPKVTESDFKPCFALKNPVWVLNTFCMGPESDFLESFIRFDKLIRQIWP